MSAFECPPTLCGRSFHLGQPAAVGPHGGDPLLGHLDQHAAKRVAAAFVVGGEQSAADQLAEQPARHLVILAVGEGGDGREFIGILGGQAEFAPLSLDHRSLLVGLDEQLGAAGAFTEDCRDTADRQQRIARFFHLDAHHLDADADFEVGCEQNG